MEKQAQTRLIPSKSLLREMRKTLKNEADPRSIANYIVATEDGIESNATDVCHARMLSRDFDTLAVLDMHYGWKEVIPKDMHETYKQVVKFVLNSGWGKAFQSNNHVNFLKHGVFLDLTQPASYVAQAVMALRMARERRTRLPVFKALRKAGLSGELSYLMMLSFDEHGKGFVVGVPGAHTPLDMHTSISKYKSLHEGGMEMFKGDKPAYKSSRWAIHSKFHSETGDGLRNVLNKMINGEKGDVVVGKGWNPDVFSIEQVIKFSKKLGAEYGL